jgi:hypothetical protein
VCKCKFWFHPRSWSKLTSCQVNAQSSGAASVQSPPQQPPARDQNEQLYTPSPSISSSDYTPPSSSYVANWTSCQTAATPSYNFPLPSDETLWPSYYNCATDYPFYQQTQTWTETIYTPGYGTGAWPVSYYQQAQYEALLNPVADFNSSWEVAATPEDGNCIVEPSGLDSAEIDPTVLGLPVNEPENRETTALLSEACPTCNKLFYGPNASKNCRCVFTPSNFF